MLTEDCLSSLKIKYIPWPPNWEEGIGNSEGDPIVSKAKVVEISETEKELIRRGIDLYVDSNEKIKSVASDNKDLILSSSFYHSQHQFLVNRIPGSIPRITVRKEEENSEVLLFAERMTTQKDVLWVISSSVCEIGDCYVYANQKKSAFYCVCDGYEEIAIQYRRPPANSKLRYLDVMIPALSKASKSKMKIKYDGTKSHLLSHMYSENTPSDCVKLTVREPQKKDGRYVLMFNGRVKRPSGKNFILISSQNPSRELLLCGKSAQDEYVLDMSWPLTLLQGFAAFLTQFSKPKPF